GAVFQGEFCDGRRFHCEGIIGKRGASATNQRCQSSDTWQPFFFMFPPQQADNDGMAVGLRALMPGQPDLEAGVTGSSGFFCLRATSPVASPLLPACRAPA